MKLLILLATVMLVAACGGGSSSSGAADAQATAAQAALDPSAISIESKLECRLIVSCKDGTEVKELVSSEAECDALREKAQTFDYDHCQVELSTFKITD
jgi:uncharacterized lipoprotein YajG